MKNRFNKIILRFCLIILISSCSKDDEFQIFFEGKKVSTIIIDGEERTRYTYKNSGLLDSTIYLSSFGDDKFYSLTTYNDENQIIKDQEFRLSSDGIKTLNEELNFFYENSLIVEMSNSDNKTVFNYENGKCNEKLEYRNDKLEEKTIYTYDQNQNISLENRIRYNDSGDFLYEIEIEYQYDSNPLAEIYIYQFVPGFPIPRNNPILRNQTAKESAPGINLSVGDSKFEYEYDSDGYPTKIIDFDGDTDAGNWSQDSITEYIYL